MTDHPFTAYTREIVRILSKMDREGQRAWLDEIREFISRRSGKPIPSIHDYIVAPDSPLLPYAERFEIFSIIVRALKSQDISLFAPAESSGVQQVRPETSG
jgi:hypothetical protein